MNIPFFSNRKKKEAARQMDEDTASAIADLQKRVAGLEETMPQIRSELSMITGNNVSIRSEISDVKGAVEVNRANIADLKSAAALAASEAKAVAEEIVKLADRMNKLEARTDEMGSNVDAHSITIKDLSWRMQSLTDQTAKYFAVMEESLRAPIKDLYAAHEILQEKFADHIKTFHEKEESVAEAPVKGKMEYWNTKV